MTESNKDYFTEMLEELRGIRDKYGLPKGILFSPDRLEISLKRTSYDNIHLSYKEYFDYLPDMALELVIPFTINSMVQIGVPRERIERIARNGVGMEIDGKTSLVTGMVLAELVIQKRFTEEELEKLFITTKRTVKGLTETSDLKFDWSDETGERMFKILQKFGEVVMANPSVISEMEAVTKKYSDSFEKVRSILENKDAETKPQ